MFVFHREMLIGILLDVSGSMRKNAVGEIEEENCEWARSTFEVIKDLVKFDISRNNHIFALGVGAKYGKGIFDFLKTIERFDKNKHEESVQYREHREDSGNDILKDLVNVLKPDFKLLKQTVGSILNAGRMVAHSNDAKLLSWKETTPVSMTLPPSPAEAHLNTVIDKTIANYDDLIEEFFQLVEKNGAPRTRKWTSKETIKSAVLFETANLLIKALKSSKEFLKEFVSYCLPSECKPREEDEGFYRKAKLHAATFIGHQASEEEISKIVEKALERLMKDVGSVYSVQRASEILNRFVDVNTLTKDKIKKLLTLVGPLIFGETPLYEALHKTTEIFEKKTYSKHKKMLFVLSDGEPTDDSSDSVFEKLKDLEVTIVCCLLTRSGNIKPRRLYSLGNREWSNGANLLFKLSSAIPSQLIPRTIFIKKGWDIEITNNETKLFIQVNHHDHIKDACNLARNVVCCQDSLADLLVSISLDIYINQSTSRFTAKRQVKGTCYANALAAVLHLSMMRILGRDKGYPSFTALRAEMIDRHGEDGAHTFEVLREITPIYRLQYEAVDVTEAMSAIAAKRPVYATFSLTDLEWEQFGDFYRRDPTGVLTNAEIDIRKRDRKDVLHGHAVVLTSFNSECFRFMNSWGDDWADMGFFKVQNSEVLAFEFCDVFWTLNDLSQREIYFFENHGAEVADKIIKSLISLQKAKYECPLCTATSLVTAFSGSLNETVCPKCKGKFRSDESGNLLALNIYLTSLSK